MVNKIKEDKYRFFKPEEFEEMYQYLNKNGKFTADFGIHTGARIFELRGFMLKPMFDDSHKTITLSITKVRAKLKERAPRSRIQPLNTRFYNDLKQKVEGKRYRVLSTNAFNVQLKRACERAKIDKPEQFSSHNIRKTFATWMLSLGVDSNRLAKHLGHTPAELFKDYTSNAYLNPKDKRIIRSILGDIPDKIDNKI